MIWSISSSLIKNPSSKKIPSDINRTISNSSLKNIGTEEPKKCLNTYGCKNDALPGQNFCSEKCRLIYMGELPPDYSNCKPYKGKDPDKKLVDNIFQKYYGNKKEQPKKRGVKKDQKRGPYKKPRLERKQKRQLEMQRKRLHRERSKRHRQKKKHLELERKKALIRHA